MEWVDRGSAGVSNGGLGKYLAAILLMKRWLLVWQLGDDKLLMLPVLLGGDPDHARSAFGRFLAEAVFWTPAALLPGLRMVWEPLNETTAQVTVKHGALKQMVDLTVDPEGRPVEVRFQRKRE